MKNIVCVCIQESQESTSWTGFLLPQGRSRAVFCECCGRQALVMSILARFHKGGREGRREGGREGGAPEKCFNRFCVKC